MNEAVKFDDATRPQVAAADPDKASWVSANAGSGKTRVLTDRVARLLLAGTPPQRILCLTFTTAAAANMQVRLFERLGEWSMLPDSELRTKLLMLGVQNKKLSTRTLEDARTLFARALETPGGLKIQTIHAFSSSLLRRFPLEAGVSPKFAMIDDRAARKLQLRVLDEMAIESPEIYDLVARAVSGARLDEFIDQIINLQDRFESPVNRKHIMNIFGLTDEQDYAEYVKDSVSLLFYPMHVHFLTSLVHGLDNDLASPRSQAGASDLREVLEGPRDESALPILVKYFLTGANAQDPFEPSAFPRKAVMENFDDVFSQMLMHYKHVVKDVRLRLLTRHAAEKTIALHEFAAAFLYRYEHRKRESALLDFSDLIVKSLHLLRDRECAQWVLYRLDGGIDHVLVDEAQDVSPRQWAIICEIAREFTSGFGAHEGTRTVFAVGDEKQSIYGFQGAAPEKFEEMRDYFRQQYEDASLQFVENELLYSFRSAEAILKMVDMVFERCRVPGFAANVRHRAFKSELPGRVDVWPFLVKQKVKRKGDDWWQIQPEQTEIDTHVKLAKTITTRILNMMERRELLPDGLGGGRPIQPGDIMILVRRRSDLFYAIIQELKSKGLPVAGADRLKLIAELAVRDLTAMLSFLAYQQDDLSLAAVLRSPLFGLTEDQLYKIAHNRGKLSLWQSLIGHKKSFHEIRRAVRIINDLIKFSEMATPYAVLERILTNHKGREMLVARLGREIEQTLDSYLQQALAYEEEGAPTLAGFLDWLTEETEIKRQLDQGVNEIRVMTIHGAKGLESPIIILPDTEHRTLPSGGIILESPDDGTPLYLTSIPESPELIERAREAKKEAEEHEQSRLMYVALTRAECWLIICGEGKLKEDCWYNRLDLNIWERPSLQVIDFSNEGGKYLNITPGVRLSTGQWPEKVAKRKVQTPTTPKLPNWVKEKLKNPIQSPLQALSPSRLGGYSSDNMSTLGDDEVAGAGTDFGTRLHLLLEHLPTVGRHQRAEAGKAILRHDDPAIDDAACQDIVNAAMELLETPELRFLLSSEAIRETEFVAVSPTLNDRQLRGKIDLLLVDNNRVLAIDFKSNIDIPDRAQNIPDYILRQMGAYQEALRAIYPNRKIETAILWTRLAKLMTIPPNLSMNALKQAADEIECAAKTGTENDG